MTKAFPLALLLSFLAGGLVLPPRSGLAAGDAITQVLALKEASLILEVDGKVRIAHLADQPMIPASTMKVVTALAAIQRWGLDHRFHTDVSTLDGWLWVTGGDPYLVSEELDRLEMHISETIKIMKKGGACGRRLDFMMQEFNRESNTLGSKSINAEVTQSAVELKVLIEQMREQIQNIE